MKIPNLLVYVIVVSMVMYINACKNSIPVDTYSRVAKADDAGKKKLANCSLTSPYFKDSMVRKEIATAWMINHKDHFNGKLPRAFFFESKEVMKLFEHCDSCNTLLVGYGSSIEDSALSTVTFYLMAGVDGQAYIPTQMEKDYTGILGYSPRFTNDLGHDDDYNLGDTVQNIHYADSNWVHPERFSKAAIQWPEIVVSQQLTIQKPALGVFSIDPVCDNLDVEGFRIYLGLRFLRPTVTGHNSMFKIFIVGVDHQGRNLINQYHHQATDCCKPPIPNCNSVVCTSCNDNKNCPCNNTCPSIIAD